MRLGKCTIIEEITVALATLVVEVKVKGVEMGRRVRIRQFNRRTRPEKSSNIFETNILAYQPINSAFTTYHETLTRIALKVVPLL